MTIQRAAKIHERLVNVELGHPEAEDVSLRQEAFLVQFERRFQNRNFELDEIEKVEFDADIADCFGLSRLGNGKLPRQDDLTVLSKHLGQRGYIIHLKGSSQFRLSTIGYEAAIAARDGALAH